MTEKLYRLPTREEFDEGWETPANSNYHRHPCDFEVICGMIDGKPDFLVRWFHYDTLEAAQAACYEDYCERLTEGLVEVDLGSLVDSAEQNGAILRTREIEREAKDNWCACVIGRKCHVCEFVDFLCDARYPEAFGDTEPTLLEELLETRREAEKLGNAARDAAAQRTREIVEVILGFGPARNGASRIIAASIRARYPEAFEQTED